MTVWQWNFDTEPVGRCLKQHEVSTAYEMDVLKDCDVEITTPFDSAAQLFVTPIVQIDCQDRSASSKLPLRRARLSALQNRPKYRSRYGSQVDR